jgi:thiol-disulfide isomerase/thioredoxin
MGSAGQVLMWSICPLFFRRRAVALARLPYNSGCRLIELYSPGMSMAGASKLMWPLALLAALPLLLSGCGSNSDPNAATQFRPVDDDEPPAKTVRPKLPDEESIHAVSPERAQSKKPGPTSSPANSVGKGETSRASEPEETEPSDDPALTGPAGAKVRLVRSVLHPLLQSLQSQPPASEKAKQKVLQQLQEVMVATEEILADEKASLESRDEALLARLQVVSVMLQIGLEKEQDAKDMLRQAATDLAQDADSSRYKTLGRVQLFQIHVMEVLQLQPADAGEVLTALDTLLEAGGDVDVIRQQVIPLVMQLERFGYAKEGVAGLGKIGDHFAGSKDPQESLLGKRMQVSALFGKLRGGEGDTEKVGDEIVAKCKEILADTNAEPNGMALLHQLAHAQAGETPILATNLYNLIEETYAEHGEAKVADKAKELVANGRKRMSLVGKPLSVMGVLVGGKAFDWNDYQGKVVLLHFWTLTNEPSLQDLSNIDRLHRKYRGRDLRIVGVNLDKDEKKVEELFETQQLPWATVTGEQASQRGFQHPTAKACGVIAEALPFSVLIGKDGKVVATGLQGPVLDEAIVKLLTAENDEPKEKTDDKPKESDSETEPDAQPDESK